MKINNEPLKRNMGYNVVEYNLSATRTTNPRL